MAGFFGIFGNKTKYIDEIDTNAESEQVNQNEAFYLTPDEAKTLGNIEFMRTPITIEKKFPKVQGKPGVKVVEQISSLTKTTIAEGGINKTTEIKNEYSSSNNGKANSSVESKGDSNLDMFRNMARQIKKP